MITMARGKTAEIAPMLTLWSDAYGAISRAKKLHIYGYSLPEDDTEVRTLLRAGVYRGRQHPSIAIRNPSPEVHARIKQQVLGRVTSDYAAI
jgi:hypothetical protein